VPVVAATSDVVVVAPVVLPPLRVAAQAPAPAASTITTASGTTLRGRRTARRSADATSVSLQIGTSTVRFSTVQGAAEGDVSRTCQPAGSPLSLPEVVVTGPGTMRTGRI
jgi:hypothetical protein